MQETVKRSKVILIIVILIFQNSCVFAQGVDSFEQRYSFIKYDLNQIIFPGDSTSFDHFIKKFSVLSQSQMGQINVVHIGGSHVQADMWSGRMRENFNRLLNQKESARGIIFPYKAVKSNGSRQFDITYNKPWEGYRAVKLTQPDNMGLMGWKATARDSGQYMDVTLTGDTITSFYFDKLRVFHDNNEISYNFTVQIGDSVYKPLYIDSCKCSEVNIKHPSNRFLLTVHKTDSLQAEFVMHGIQTYLHKPLLTYHSVGVNGASLSTYLNCNLLASQLVYLKPDLIIFSIGINDSFDKNFTQEVFEANYNELIRQIRTTCPDASFLFVTNTDSYKRYRKKIYKNHNGAKVQKAIMSLGKQHNAAVWDLYAVMGGSGSIIKWRKSGLGQRDLIHLTQRGYYHLGDLLFDAIMKRYQLLPNTQ